MSFSAAQWTSDTTVANLVPQASLNALANGSYAVSSAVIDNGGATRNFYLDIEIVLASAATAGAGNPRIDIWLLPAPDGTNVPTPPGLSAAAAPAIYWVGQILANVSASFTRGVCRGIILPPYHYAILIQNNLGVALPSSASNALTGYAYREEVGG